MTRSLTIAACLFVSAALATAAFAAQNDTSPAAATATAAPAAVANAAPAPAAIVGNAKTGAQLVFTCHGCHGVTGYKNAYPNYHVPRIGGQSPTYLINALHAYRDGTRKHPTMQAQAQSFSDQDVADIAAFLSTLK